MAKTPEELLTKYEDLGRIAKDLGDLASAIRNERGYTEPMNWEPWREKLEVQNQQIRERRFKIAFAGGFSVGKSFLLSSFLGKPGLLPSYNKPTTGVACAIRKGSRRMMEVHYWSRTESDEMQRFYLTEMGIPKSVPVGEGPAAVEKAKAAGGIPIEKRRVVDDYSFLRKAHEKFAHKLGTSHEVEMTEVRPEHRAAPTVKDYPWMNYILKVDATEGEPNQDLLRTIRTVVIYVDSPYLTETVEVYDLPGAGASDPLDGFIQRYFLHQTDGAIVTTRATDPFGEQEQAVIDILKENRGALTGRIFVTVTMFDRLSGPELEGNRLDTEYKSLRRRLRDDAGLGADVPFWYVSPYVTAIAERERAGEKLGENDMKSLEGARSWQAPKTNNAELDAVLATYKRDGGLPTVRQVLLESFRLSMVRLKLQQVTKGLQMLAQQLDGTYKKKWDKAKSESGAMGARRFTQAIKYLHGSRDTFVKRSQGFRREKVLKQPFEDVFRKVQETMGKRITAYMEQCKEEALRHEFDGLGGGREPNELLARFRERAEAQILEDFSELVWDRMPRPSFQAELDMDGDGVTDEKPHSIVPELTADARGLLRRYLRDGYYEAIKKDELLTLVTALLPNNPDERVFFTRVFEELDLTLEITTRNFVMREALELKEPSELDGLADGSAAFPDWARRFAKDYGQVLAKKLEGYIRKLKGYLWNMYFKHLEEAETRLAKFLGSDELLGLVTVHINDIALPNVSGGVGSPAKLIEHHEAWKTVDAALTTLDRELAS